MKYIIKLQKIGSVEFDGKISFLARNVNLLYTASCLQMGLRDRCRVKWVIMPDQCSRRRIAAMAARTRHDGIAMVAELQRSE